MAESRAGWAKYRSVSFRQLPSASADIRDVWGRKLGEVANTKSLRVVTIGSCKNKVKRKMRKIRPVDVARPGKRSPPVGAYKSRRADVVCQIAPQIPWRRIRAGRGIPPFQTTSAVVAARSGKRHPPFDSYKRQRVVAVCQVAPHLPVGFSPSFAFIFIFGNYLV